MFSTDSQAMESQFRAALHSIAHDPRFNDVHLSEVLNFIVKTASTVLDCERVSTWEYVDDPTDGKSIQCTAFYDRESGYGEIGATLSQGDAGSYLNALEVDSLLIMNDVLADQRCVELNLEYLPANKITSMLDAPYEFNGQLAGVLCMEHVGPARVWTAAEQHFCSNMGSLLTIAQEREHRRNSELQLRDEEDRYRSLVENLAMGLIISIDNQFVFANNAAADIFGVEDPTDVLGLQITTFFPHIQPHQLDDWQAEIRGSKSSQEVRLKRHDDITLTLDVTASLVTWQGKTAVQAIMRDITESAGSQLRLERSERLLSQAQRIARIGSWVWDLKTGETECSLELQNLLGLPPENPISKPILELAHPQDKSRLEAAQAKTILSKESYRITYRVNVKSGWLWLEETGVPELDQDQNVARIYGTSRDVTRQKFAEQEARNTEERFSALANTFPGGFIYCDPSSRYLFINETYAEWWNVDPSDFLGRTIADFVGDTIYPEIEPFVDAVVSGESVTFERIPLFENAPIDKIQCTFAPDIGVNGEMRGFFGLITDITEQRSIELALRQAQKMEAMGQLTGGIAHDFNNMLAILMGNLELAKNTVTDPKSKKYIGAALQGVERGVAITQKLLGFARNNTPGEQIIRLDGTIIEVKDMITQSLAPNIELSIETDDNLWAVQVDTGDFKDAIINLCINARDAMTQGGKLLLNTSNKRIDDSSQKIHHSLLPGDYVLVSVTDTGTGMDAETKERLFEPFYTTKPEGKGTGLGMSMVFGFVKRCRGEVLVYSATGEGTTINMYLPRSTSEPMFNQSEIPTDKSLKRESILIVDDEQMVAKVAADILNELGYQTLVAATTNEALALIKKGEKVDLLFSDVVMPDDLNGFEFARQAIHVRPGLKILLTSGFSKFRGVEPVDQDSRWLAENILSKPYNRQELASSVKKILGKA